MQLDWITVAAQIVNFLILVWLLHRFLYGPITRAMARREERIRGLIEAAEGAQVAADARQRELDEKIRVLDAQREERLAEARAAADELKRQLEHEVRADVDGKRRAWMAELSEDRAEFLAGLREKVAQEFRRLAEDALGVLANSTLSERMAEVLLSRLQALEPEAAERLAKGARREGALRIEAGSELDAGLRRRLTRAIHERLGDDIEVVYRDAVPGLIGIRIQGAGATIEWSVDEYLDRFADELTENFPKEFAGRGAAAGEQTGAGGGTRPVTVPHE